MKSIVIYGLILAALGTCRKENKSDIPSCVQNLIEEIKKNLGGTRLPK